MSETDCGPALHIHNYPADGRMEQALKLLRQQTRTLENLMALVDEFRAEIAMLREVRPAMEAAFAKIEAKLDAALADDVAQEEMRAQLEGVRDELRSERAALVASVVENTPADEPAPEPAPPADEPPPATV